MIDIHAHILFGVDDGPKTKEESLELLELLQREGVSQVIATSHADHPQFHVLTKEVKSQVPLLNAELLSSKSPITIHSGHEVRITEKVVGNVRDKSILTLADSNYLLLELPSGTVPAYTTRFISDLIGEGITPIIAHPERNRAIAEKPERLERLVRAGALAQITAGSVSGAFGKAIQKLSFRLLEANLIHVYGSDAHNGTVRKPCFADGLDALEKKKMGPLADILLTNNERVLRNQPLILLNPETPRKKTKWFSFR